MWYDRPDICLGIECFIFHKKVRIFRTLHTSFACSCLHLHEVLLIREDKEFK
jgi:hypothetical protein